MCAPENKRAHCKAMSHRMEYWLVSGVEPGQHLSTTEVPLSKAANSLLLGVHRNVSDGPVWGHDGIPSGAGLCRTTGHHKSNPGGPAGSQKWVHQFGEFVKMKAKWSLDKTELVRWMTATGEERGLSQSLGGGLQKRGLTVCLPVAGGTTPRPPPHTHTHTHTHRQEADLSGGQQGFLWLGQDYRLKLLALLTLQSYPFPLL